MSMNFNNVIRLIKLHYDWALCLQLVLQMQREIAKAFLEGNSEEVVKLQNKLVTSLAGRVVAIVKVLTNPGRNTAGIDGKTWQRIIDITVPMKNLKHLEKYIAKPVRRVYIPKADGTMRPLGIPTMFDRAVQALYNLALVPIAECTADKHSYGYRKYRSVHDAATAIWFQHAGKNCTRWVLEADISKFFDKISHKWLLDHIPMDKRILGQFIKAGFLDDGIFHPTSLGTPQGGLISPTLANMVLDGLQARLGKRFVLIRYADDFVVTSFYKNTLTDHALPIISKFLAERGLELNMNKTRVVSIDQGFDFLGFHFKEYKDPTRAVGNKKKGHS
jgi:RNA-directed DNA polymerase